MTNTIPLLQHRKLYLRKKEVWTSVIGELLRSKIRVYLSFPYPGIHKRTCANWISPITKRWAIGDRGTCKIGLHCYKGYDKKCPQFIPRTGTFLTKNGSFPTGLIMSLEKRLLDDEGIATIIYDERNKPNTITPKSKWEWIGPELFEHQERAKERFLVYGSGIIKAPTGSGKTMIASSLIQHLSLTTIYLVNTRPLLHQTIDAIQQNIRIPVGQIGAGKWEEAPITVATVQSLSENPDRAKSLLSKVDFIVLDETHHVASSTFYKVAGRCPAYYRLGLSATPLCNEELLDLRVVAMTGPVIVNIDEEDMIKAGHIASPKFKIYKYKEDETEDLELFTDRYRRYVTLNGKYNSLLVEVIQPYVDGDYKVLVLLEHARHMEVLSRLLVGVQKTWGSDPELEDKLKWFKNTDSGCLICTPVLAEGIDVPSVDILVLAGQGKKWTRTIQQMGRGMRRGKDNKLVVIDVLMDGIKYFTDHGKTRIATYRKIYPNADIDIIKKSPQNIDVAIDPLWYDIDERADLYDVLPSDLKVVDAMRTYEVCVSDLNKRFLRLFKWDSIKTSKQWDIFEKIVECAEIANRSIDDYIKIQFRDLQWVKMIHDNCKYPTPAMLTSNGCVNRAIAGEVKIKTPLEHQIMSSWHIVKTVSEIRNLDIHLTVKMVRRQLHSLWLAGYYMVYKDVKEEVRGKEKSVVLLLEKNIKRIEHSMRAMNNKQKEYLKTRFEEVCR